METYGIEKYGIRDPKSVNRNVSPAVLVETALRTEPCRLTDKGALLIETGKYTGRSPKDRFIADEDGVRDEINWGAENQKISAETVARWRPISATAISTCSTDTRAPIPSSVFRCA